MDESISAVLKEMSLGILYLVLAVLLVLAAPVLILWHYIVLRTERK